METVVREKPITSIYQQIRNNHGMLYGSEDDLDDQLQTIEHKEELNDTDFLYVNTFDEFEPKE